MENTALITGGCGFVGRHFSKKMTELGYTVTVVDNLVSDSSLSPENWPSHLKCDVEFHNMDIISYFETTKIKFNVIIHTAAIVGGRKIIESDPLLIATNIHIDISLFRWIESANPDHLIYFSSSAVYPIKFQNAEYNKCLQLQDVNIEKDVISVPDLTYGWSKLTGEFLLNILSNRVNTTISIYRPFSGYGEDQHSSYPFTSILSKVMSNQSVVDVWSDAVRDFVYIDDIVDYVLLTYKSNKFNTLNIGSGVATSMSDLARLMSKVLNVSKEITILNNKPKGVYYRVCEENSDFEWTPLERGISRCVRLLSTQTPYAEQCAWPPAPGPTASPHTESS